jgi:RNA polymerase sigma-70 factor (ECF subfamily)
MRHTACARQGGHRNAAKGACSGGQKTHRRPACQKRQGLTSGQTNDAKQGQDISKQGATGFERQMSALRSWFGRRLRNPVDVDDAVQDVWLRSHAHLDRGAVDNVPAYLFQTAQSVLTDRARRAAVRREARHEALEDFHHPVEWITPERVLMGEEAVERIVARLGDMPERTRDIFLLHRFENISYGEIAMKMGISVSAVEKHIMKALLLLKEERA